MEVCKTKLRNGDVAAIQVFKIIHYKHGGIVEKDMSPKWMRKLLRYTLQRELPIDNSPRTLIAVLQTIHKRTLPKMQVDCLIKKGGLFGQFTESIPYAIAKTDVGIDVNQPIGEWDIPRSVTHLIEYIMYVLSDKRLSTSHSTWRVCL